MLTLPEDVAHYKSTPEFTETTIPAGLLRSHSTAAGVWGRIKVLEGTLLYRVLEPALQEYVLAPDHPGIIEPQAKHEVAAIGPVRFCVEFHRK
ncbi:DUF1971 domain-containing protein [Massilia sp. R2A-15]|uniref:DUF1971 domain-containing protein n=1 Tax=Massilia sp. R2A-15 TaxID=3064278 RepID=UPI002734FD00|nr:DUF1971 domain-containing protein [Massilia sp. R2A-15]WLI91706.1 DUF1971 domain-containing protein [Massilia sp. R2A-15]